MSFIDKDKDVVGYIKEVISELKDDYECLIAYDILLDMGICVSSFEESVVDFERETYTLFDLNKFDKGVYIGVNDSKKVLFKNDLSDDEKRVVLTHELGHVILHPNVNFFDISSSHHKKYEYEADVFASEFLIDDNDILEYRGYSCEQIANILGVSKKLIELKIDNMDKSKLLVS